MVQRITIDPPQLQADGSLITLSADQSHYLRHVLRMKVGDRFIAQDGSGHQWLSAIEDRPNQARILEELPNSTRPSATLRLIAALPKGNSFDAVVRQTTELGVTHIHPVTTQRTLLKPSAGKIARWKRIAAEASEQSERVTVPEIAEPVSFPTCLKLLSQNVDTPEHSLRFICAARTHLRAAPAQADEATSLDLSPLSSNKHLLARLLFHQQQTLSSENLQSITIAVGPEGGWTTEEITVATAYSYEVVSLGSVILRAVTAPITALSLVTGAREALI